MRLPCIPAHPARVIGSLCVVLSAILFACKAILIKYAYGIAAPLDAVTLLALRMGTALPFFMLMAVFATPADFKAFNQPRFHTRQVNQQRGHAGRWQDWALLLIAGLIGYYLASLLDFMGLMLISASLERIILFLYPTLTVIASAILTKTPIAPRIWLAIVLSYGGTVLVMQAELGQALQAQHLLWGSSLVFASAIAYALYLLMTPTLITRFGSWRFTGLAMSIACLASLLHYALATAHPWQALQQLATEVIWLGAALGFFATVLPATLLMQGIARIGPAQAALLSACGPIVTLLLAVALLGEQLTLLQWLGCSISMAGVLMISLAPRQAAVPPVPSSE